MLSFLLAIPLFVQHPFPQHEGTRGVAASGEGDGTDRRGGVCLFGNPRMAVTEETSLSKFYLGLSLVHRMQGGRRSQDSFSQFSDPFADFRGFGGTRPGSLLSSFFGGRDPFDDPFFSHPFGSPFGSPFAGPFGSPFAGSFGSPFASRFQPGMFGPGGIPLFDSPATGFLEHQQPHPNKRRGPVIEELNSDDENAEDEAPNDKKDNSRKHSRLAKEPYIEDPDDEAQETNNNHIQYRNAFNGMSNMQPQPQSRNFTFQSSTVTYGGADGAYYTKSTTRRTGGDGVTLEECKEADSSTGQANHQISRGLNNKGHTFSRKLNSDGRVDTMQTLHNLNEDELTGFEETWKRNAGKHLPGWRERLEGHSNFGPSSSSSSKGGWALPSTQFLQHSGQRVNPNTASRTAAAQFPGGNSTSAQ
ncbi:hypothetical protein Nepgr_011331 [Nepenthes gracilis]|uniref:Glycine-rich protein n=1 Tax=Nepenthes gracilis TaxID=150966 RepID=A0AAD3SEZ8_NEPGR|nr:hypothetical protein Nepgr_011331 [Nepenthes gracilis]